MPSETMDLQGLSSSSFISNDAHFPTESHTGYWKLDGVANHGKSSPLSPLGRITSGDNQAVKAMEHHEPFAMYAQKVNFDRRAVGAERKINSSISLLNQPGTRSDLNVQQTSYFTRDDRFNPMSAQYENSLFSSSLSELFSRKMRLSSNDDLYGHSADKVTHQFEEEEPFESNKEIEAQTIGDLLPNEDELLSGLTDELDYSVKTSGGNDWEELDVFSSVGGMDLGDDGSDTLRTSEFSRGARTGQLGMSNGSVARKFHYDEHPSRTLFVRNVNNNVEDSEFRAIFEQYGDIDTLSTACKSRGFIMISYYDIRAAQNAMKALQNRTLMCRNLDIHYSVPKENLSDNDMTRGTLMVIPLDSSVSNDEIRQIFGVFGEIKEICETTHNSHHKVIEFYDVRAVEAALHGWNKGDIARNRIKLEACLPGGSVRLGQQSSLDFEQQYSIPVMQQNGLPITSVSSGGKDNGTILASRSAVPFLGPSFNHGIPNNHNRLSSWMGIESVANQSAITESGYLSQANFNNRGATTFRHHSLPEYHDELATAVHRKTTGHMGAIGTTNPEEENDRRRVARVGSIEHSVELNEGVFGSTGKANYPLAGHRCAWSNLYHANHPSMIWSNSPPSLNGIATAHSPVPLHGFLKPSSHLMHSVIPMNSHHVGSAPTVTLSPWDSRHAYAGESPEVSGFQPHSLGSMRMPNSSLQHADFVSHNTSPHVGGNGMNVPIPSKNEALQSHHQRFPGRGQMMNGIDHRNERTRGRRSEENTNQADRKQYELDVDRILRGEDKRTTLMIKNIPNKYTSKMLLAAIDEGHRGTYDFIYLPIDFKNKCNVGYAFINMTDPSLIIPFYKAFNGKKWEKFNSEKVASLAYARIQGKSSLVAHFQNSSLMNEDKRCRPILFNSEGPNVGDQVPFPTGVNVRTRKTRTITHEENQLESSPRNSENEDDSSN